MMGQPNAPGGRVQCAHCVRYKRYLIDMRAQERHLIEVAEQRNAHIQALLAELDTIAHAVVRSGGTIQDVAIVDIPLLTELMMEYAGGGPKKGGEGL